MTTKSFIYRKKTSFGFTLIELMIVVAIIAILASIAYPSYQDSVRKARRADAQAEMMAYATVAERIFTEANSYANAAASLPANTAFYTYAVQPAAPVLNFTVTATPIGNQTPDRCGTMSLTNTGLTSTNPVVVGCWN